MKYNHKEAFCQMIYQCEECGCLEILWNSRDGVTPFAIGCCQCNGTMQHAYWNLDRCIPDYKPPKGSRIFTDITVKDSYRIAVKRIEAINNEPNMKAFHISPEDKDYRKRIESIAEDIFHDGAAPIIKIAGEDNAN